MCAYRDGRTAAFDELYARHKNVLYGFMLRNCGEEQLANELYQDVWLRLINARAQYRPDAKFRTWLFTIAHNRLKDHYRAQARRTARIGATAAPVEDLPDQAPLPLDLAQQQELHTLLVQHIATLPLAQREAFLLHEEAGLSIDEIGEATGVGRETAKSRLRYAVAKLRRGMEER